MILRLIRGQIGPKSSLHWVKFGLKKNRQAFSQISPKSYHKIHPISYQIVSYSFNQIQIFSWCYHCIKLCFIRVPSYALHFDFWVPRGCLDVEKNRWTFSPHPDPRILTIRFTSISKDFWCKVMYASFYKIIKITKLNWQKNLWQKIWWMGTMYIQKSFD